MALVDPNGRYLEVNTTHARMLGVDDPDEMIGLSFEHFVHPDDVADTFASIKRLHETGTDHGERRYIRKDGATVYALFGSSVVRDADGRPSVLFSQVEDITDRTLAEAALRASEERFRTGFENSPIGMTLTGLDGRLVEVNATFARMLGYDDPPSSRDRASRPSSIPTNWPRDRRRSSGSSSRGATTGRGATSAGTGLSCTRCMGRRWSATRTGDRRCCSGRCRTSPSASSRRPRCFALTPSSRGASCSERPSSRLPIRSSKRSPYSLAHDLRAPIRAISAFGAVLAQDHGDRLGDQGRETLDRIRRASARMGELIDAMLLIGQPGVLPRPPPGEGQDCLPCAEGQEQTSPSRRW